MASAAEFRHARYELVRLLGEGGMGRVHLARDLLEDGLEVALKVYPPRFGDERLRREFLALRDLHHPGVARAFHYGVSELDGAPFFTLEFVAGKTLTDFLDGPNATGKPLRGKVQDLALELLRRTATALAYLHRRSILHLDLKPENILVTDRGPGFGVQPVLIDFGLVRALHTDSAPLGYATLPYAAPEILRGRSPTPASDVYSLGATFYRVFAGEPPVRGKDLAEVLKAHERHRAPSLAAIPAPLEGVLRRALAKEPRRRYGDAGELLQALTAAAPEHFEKTSPHVSYHEPDFVGRRAELRAFETWLAKDRSKAPVFTVRGDNGWGKTRLLEKLETRLEIAGRSTLRIRCDGEGGVAWLIDCVRKAERLGADPKATQALFSELSVAAKEDTTVVAGDALDKDEGQSRLRLWSHAVAEVLLPLLRDNAFLLIDDLHLVGHPGNALLTRLTELLLTSNTPAGGGVVVTTRATTSQATSETTGPDDKPPARRSSRGASSQSDDLTVVDLGPLSRREALAIDLEGLDGALAGWPPSRVRTLKATLHEAVGGHPLFYVRGLLDLAGVPDAAATLAPTDWLPARLQRLDENDRAVARCLALLGRAVSLGDLRGLLNTDETTIQGRIERLRLGGFVTATPRRVQMVHESVSTAVITALSKKEQRAVHQQLATGLAECAGEPGRSSLRLEAAWHAWRADDRSALKEQTKRWLQEGGHLPATQAERGCEALAKAAVAADQKPSEGRRLLEASAEILEQLGRYEESHSVLARLTRRAPATAYRLFRKLGSAALRAGKAKSAITSLRRCVTQAAAKEAPVEFVRASAELALLHHFRGETEAALEHGRIGVSQWTRLCGSKRRDALASAIKLNGVIGQVCIRRLQLDEAIASLTTGLAAAEAQDAKTNVSLLLNNLALAHHLDGRFTAALETFARAERCAVDLHDQAALASIRANVVQIHAKQGRFPAARERLDDLEKSPAVTQSPRLRLGCLYSRGLLANLLHGEADEIWEEVEELAQALADPFLRRFCHVQRAEGHLTRGRYHEARQVLSRKARGHRTQEGPKVDPLERVHEALRSARLATLEALVGRVEVSRRLRQALASEKLELPSQLGAWNSLYLAMAAMESNDFTEARSHLQRATKLFDSTGFAVGQIECALTQADLSLREAPGEVAAAKEARDAIERAQRIPIESSPGESPRDRDLRATLLEARCVAVEILACLEQEGFPAGLEGLERALGGLLARAGGDPGRSQPGEHHVVFEMLNSVAARLRSDRAAATAAVGRVCTGVRVQAMASSPKDQEGLLGRDPWDRYGLARLRPAAGAPRLTQAHSQALEDVLVFLGETESPASGTDSLGFAAEVLGKTLAATRIVLWSASGHAMARWELEASPPATPQARAHAFCRRQGVLLATLEVQRSATRPFIAAEQLVIELVAKALLSHLAANDSIGGTASKESGHSATRPHSTETRLLDSPPSSETTSAESGLAETRTLSIRRPDRALVRALLEEEGIVVAGAALRRVIDEVEKLAAADIPVLVEGESGTGKDLIARLLHVLSPRASGPYVSQSASALPRELFEADLFGYEQGAFTGAEQHHTGFLFRATGGTFHLEEIGDLPEDLQQRFLRLLEDNVVRPLGATTARSLDVRFVASTHRDLKAIVKRGEFRGDLFYRLGAVSIHIPPLRERPDEIPALAEHYWQKFTGTRGRFPTRTRQTLQAHDWPGNVRELMTVLRRLSLDVSGLPTAGDVRRALGPPKRTGPFPPALFEAHEYEGLARALEESYLKHLLKKHDGNLERIAAELRTTTRSVYRRFERLGLRPKDLFRT